MSRASNARMSIRTLLYAIAVIVALTAALIMARSGTVEPSSAASPPRSDAMPAQASARFEREPNLDRSGNDISRAALQPGAAIDQCEALCLATTGCQAYTYVKQSSTVPAPICWLKDTVPTGYESSCCTSGVLKR